MPEIADLSVYKKHLKEMILNKKINHIEIMKDKRMKPNKESIVNNLVHSFIIDIKRHGKELYFYFDNGNIISIHLMLKGEFYYEEYIEQKDNVIKFEFEDKTTFWIKDSKGLTTIELNPLLPTVIDALEITQEQFLELVANNPKKNIKAFLIDQDLIRGIGNAYADEILYAANVSPKSIVGNIPNEIIIKIYQQMDEVIHQAIKIIPTISPNIIRGEIREFMKVHRKDITKTEKKEDIIIEQIAGKKTYFTTSQIEY